MRHSIWESYKLVAPYLYALHLEKSFRPAKIERANDVLDWASTFVKSPRRIGQILGRAAFAMDVIKIPTKPADAGRQNDRTH
jgi:hypothetical protein